MSNCNFSRMITMYETGGLDNDMKKHLQNCSDCQKRFHNFLALTVSMVLERTGCDDENYTELPDVALPDKLKKMVDARKTKWHQQQLGRVLQFRSIKNKQEQKKIMDRLMDEEPVDLPKAAFPDDLKEDED